MTGADFLAWEQASRDTIDVKRIYIDIAGDLVSGILLSQIIYYWTPNRDGGQKQRIERDGREWITRAREDWWDECRISPKQFDRASEVLAQQGLITKGLFHHEGTPTLHLSLDVTVLFERVKSILTKGENRGGGGGLYSPKVEMDIPQRGNCLHHHVESPNQNPNPPTPQRGEELGGDADPNGDPNDPNLDPRDYFTGDSEPLESEAAPQPVAVQPVAVEPVAVEPAPAGRKGRKAAEPAPPPVGIKQMMEAMEAVLGHAPPAPPRQARAMKAMLNQGYTPEEIVACWRFLRDAWAGKGLPDPQMWHAETNINGWKAGRLQQEKHRGRAETRDDGPGEQTWGWIKAQDAKREVVSQQFFEGALPQLDAILTEFKERPAPARPARPAQQPGKPPEERPAHGQHEPLEPPDAGRKGGSRPGAPPGGWTAG